MKHSAMRHRNASDFPHGDREKLRDKERMSLTTARFYHGNVCECASKTLFSTDKLLIYIFFWHIESRKMLVFFYSLSV